MFVTENSAITIKSPDYRRLLGYLNQQESELADALDAELSRADVVEPDQFPTDAVSMGSRVTYQDLDTQAVTTVTLVYPEQANLELMRVSVLSPMGVALLGLRVGERFAWTQPTGKIRHIGITEVVQPDAEIL